MIHSTSFEALNEGYAERLEDNALDSDEHMSPDDGSDFDEDPDSDDEME